VRNRADKYRTAFGAMRSRLDREPSTRELAVELGVADEEIDALRRDSNFSTVYTLSREDDSNEEPHQVRKIDVLMDHDSEVPFDDMVTKDLAVALAERLTRVERTVVALYYRDGLTMKEIGFVLKISESRVCQIHTKLLRKLKGHLDAIVQGTDKPQRVPASMRREAMAVPMPPSRPRFDVPAETPDRATAPGPT